MIPGAAADRPLEPFNGTHRLRLVTEHEHGLLPAKVSAG